MSHSEVFTVIENGAVAPIAPRKASIVDKEIPVAYERLTDCNILPKKDAELCNLLDETMKELLEVESLIPAYRSKTWGRRDKTGKLIYAKNPQGFKTNQLIKEIIRKTSVCA